MENKPIVTVKNEISNFSTLQVDTSELPEIISKQVNKMKELEEKIKNVMKEAENAKKAANSNKKVGFLGGRKRAIEELQYTARKMALAIQTNADALQLTFEFQKQLTDISKFLLRLGLTNIANNRIVVRELELRLKGASKQKISELAKQELLSVVRQLKAQQDLFIKQEQLNQKIKELNNKIDQVVDLKILQLEEENKKLRKEIKEMKTVSEKQEMKIEKLKKKLRKRILSEYKSNIISLTKNKLKIVVIIFFITIILLGFIFYFLFYK